MSEIFGVMERRFTSLNSVPVERVHITGEEWNQIKAALAQGGQGAEPIGQICDDGEGAYVELYDDYSFLIGQPVYTHPQPAVPEGFAAKVQALCDAVKNDDDLPLTKYALRCGRLVNEVQDLLSTPTTPQVDGCIKSSERLPTQKDADPFDRVFAWNGTQWFLSGWNSPDFARGWLSYWKPTDLKRPQPPKEGYGDE